ncbi:hypothetical protein HXA31_14210 [Salipaludibacillus agaradhaerens]|uniref:Uncharacterized protein n=1 Tax=Salipaludibacillus agaradhaerens TaxID=76935 RepID=A0A9Q4B582_SALAG|nr:hypothetical protein [Salipaludibacillus agaradhaerens]MCR6115518.1 hypothetical protein [Salipaludibacillus agaradhaerens]
MVPQPKCKSCLQSVKLTKVELAQMMQKQTEEIRDLLVPIEVYFKRLAACELCEDLQYETTCRYNGMLVQYMARLKNKQCPRPGGGKWFE